MEKKGIFSEKCGDFGVFFLSCNCLDPSLHASGEIGCTQQTRAEMVSGGGGHSGWLSGHASSGREKGQFQKNSQVSFQKLNRQFLFSRPLCRIGNE